MRSKVRVALAIVGIAGVAALGCPPPVDSASPRRAPVAPPPPTARSTSDSVLPLVPRPITATTLGARTFPIDTSTVIVASQGTEPIARMLAAWLGIPANVRGFTTPIPHGAIELSHRPKPGAREGSYTIKVDEGSIDISASSHEGLFYGAETLALIAGSRPIAGARPRAAPYRIPMVTVQDEPRHAFRAMHLDVARHFFDKATVLRWIDLLAFYKYNVFHWHLTDDQGFRLQLPSHPELAQIGGRRTEADGTIHEGAFSPADVAEVVAYAKARFIEVVPEIEMPGHTRAILAAHPELSCTGAKQPVPSTWGVFEDVLCAGNDATYTLLEDVIADVAKMFPGPYIHVGGDEVPKKRWNACPKCRAKMQKEGLADAEKLQGAFGKRVAAMLAKHGKKPMVWDEALDGGLPEGALVVAWRGEHRTKDVAEAWSDVVAAPWETVYFNHWQTRERGGPGHAGYVPYDKALAFDPVPRGLDAEHQRHVRGGEGCLWTEYVKTRDDLDLLAMPRMAALAEALWSGPNAAKDFVQRFGASLPLLDAAGIQYFVEPPLGLAKKRVFLDKIEMHLKAPAFFPGAIARYTVDGNDPSRISYEGSSAIFDTTTDVAARLFLPNSERASHVIRGRFEKQVPRPGLPPQARRSGIAWTYYEGDFHALPDFAKLVPKKRGLFDRNAFDFGFDPSFRAERFAILFEGFFRAHATGVARFVATADDGIAIDVDGETILEDDGEHAARESEGEIAVAEGLHRIRVRYFQGGGGKTLRLDCLMPGEQRGSELNPRASFCEFSSLDGKPTGN